MRHQLGVALALLCLNPLLQVRFGRLHNIGDLVVSKPAVGVNHRLVKFVACHLPERRDLHLTHHREPVDFGF